MHFYPNYDYARAIGAVFSKLKEYRKQVAVESGALAILVLTERDDCTFYGDLASYFIDLGPAFKISKLDLGVLIYNAEDSLVIFPGRQINTKERVELLSLGSDHLIPSGLDLATTLQKIIAGSGLPVINWAPGKWLFTRGRLIKKLILNSKGNLFLCDTSLRPKYFPRPSLMRLAESRGIPVINGSDPLPHEDEQGLIFSYLAYYQVEFNLAEPLESFKKLIIQKPQQLLGARSSLWQLFQRLKRYKSKS